jgi:hypothetical protein
MTVPGTPDANGSGSDDGRIPFPRIAIRSCPGLNFPSEMR